MTTEGTRQQPDVPVRVLVADDQKVVRDGLALLLGLLPGVEVVGTAVDGFDALLKVADLDPDVVLMDLIMPACDGVEATRQLVSTGSRTRVVVLTTYSDDEWVFAALRAGARGFLTKGAGAEEIEHAIVTVAAGDAGLDPTVQGRLLDALRSGATFAAAPPGTEPPRPDDSPARLTARERQVLDLIAAGLSNTEVARRLYVSEATVKTHVNHLLAKTGQRDRAQLVSYAYRHGFTH